MEISTAKENLHKIGNNIKQNRQRQGLKQNELARLCKMEKASISRIESGQNNVTMSTLLSITGVLQIAFADLFI